VAKSRIVAGAEYRLYRLFAGRIRALDDAAIDRWGGWLGGAARRMLGKRRRLAVRNIQATFPEKSAEECEAIARASWRHFASTFLESIRAQARPPEEIAAAVAIEGLENLEKALARERGLILVTAHFGAWELGSNLLPLYLPRAATVARGLDNERLDAELRQVRGGDALEIVDRRGAARPLARALKERRAVVLLVDQHVIPREGIRIPFLGRPAWTTTAPARLALRFGTPILPVFCYPGRIEIEQPLWPEGSVESITGRINDIIGERIRRNPELWFWMHNRWK
jgi:lauroyl/myristoyl acyltransferase